MRDHLLHTPPHNTTTTTTTTDDTTTASGKAFLLINNPYFSSTIATPPPSFSSSLFLLLSFQHIIEMIHLLLLIKHPYLGPTISTHDRMSFLLTTISRAYSGMFLYGGVDGEHGTELGLKPVMPVD